MPPSPAVEAFGPEHADVYERVYRARGKDWKAEARDVARRIRSVLPGASSLLDVGCGTGAHLEVLSGLFDRVEGLEISLTMRERSRRRLPSVPVHSGDMRNFGLGRSFDAVTCLFTSVNYVGGVPELRDAVRRMADHLVPGGVLVVEPWWFPERFLEGHVAGDLVREGDQTIARVSHSRREGRATRLEVHWTVAGPSGVSGFTEVEHLMMFTEAEYRAAFDLAGCDVDFHGTWLTGRGLFVGVRR
ncbi:MULTISPECIES: class I SAM-dependent methyltransferase [Nocardiopsis]|uniref:SAM-dependent methyltransferase n=1 Tax=Nocardiopsis sinuspersici TaxID=501010 RepID=A0A1V3C8P4_9ACTN|nr:MULTISPECIES: class I SAM-dependent methyltransferase [Nocardiopsis]OOC57012.1 SAM-dependent methyltransferase [Nocardiopsis sinuspersici]